MVKRTSVTIKLIFASVFLMTSPFLNILLNTISPLSKESYSKDELDYQPGPVMPDRSESGNSLIAFTTLPGNSDTFLTKRDNPLAATHGVTGNERIPLAKSNASSPLLAYYNNYYYLVWIENEDAGSSLYFSRRSNSHQWVTPQRVESAGDTVAPDSRPAMAIDQWGTVHIAWIDIRHDNYDLYYSNLTAGNSSWSTPEVLNDYGDQAWFPGLSTDTEGNVYAVWRDSRDSGAPDDPKQNQTYIYASKRPANTGRWGLDVRVSNTTDIENRDTPTLTCWNGTVYFTWADFREGNSDIYFDKIAADASIWSTGGNYNTSNQRVNPDDTVFDQVDPTIAVDSVGDIFIAWADNKNSTDSNKNWDIYASVLPIGVNDWNSSIPVQLNDDPNHQPTGQPVLAVDGSGTIIAAWMDGRDRTGPFFDWGIYTSRIWVNQRQIEFEANTRISTESTGNSQEQPTLAVSPDGCAFAVWRDFRDGDPHLYAADLSPAVHINIYLPMVSGID